MSLFRKIVRADNGEEVVEEGDITTIAGKLPNSLSCLDTRS